MAFFFYVHPSGFRSIVSPVPSLSSCSAVVAFIATSAYEYNRLQIKNAQHRATSDTVVIYVKGSQWGLIHDDVLRLNNSSLETSLDSFRPKGLSS